MFLAWYGIVPLPSQVDRTVSSVSTPKVKLRGVSRSFRSGRVRVDALEAVDLEIEAGEFVCLLGESGCGKSTLLHLIAGLDQPTVGSIEVDGSPIDGPGVGRSMVFQSPLLFPWLSVRQNISLGLSIKGRLPKERANVDALMSLVGLESFASARPRELSGGMAQRVALARALAPGPEVLLLDEPYSALDMVTRQRLQEELIRIWRERMTTTVFVTHDIDEAVFLGTKIVIMTPRPGRIARVIRNPMIHPRARSDEQLSRLKQMISREFMLLREEQIADGAVTKQRKTQHVH